MAVVLGDKALVAINVILQEMGQVDLTVQNWMATVWNVMQKVERYPAALPGPQKKEVVLSLLKMFINMLPNSDEKEALLTLHANVPAAIDLMVSIANTTEKLGTVAVHSCCS
jgi:hypothetical protein